MEYTKNKLHRLRTVSENSLTEGKTVLWVCDDYHYCEGTVCHISERHQKVVVDWKTRFGLSTYPLSGLPSEIKEAPLFWLNHSPVYKGMVLFHCARGRVAVFDFNESNPSKGVFVVAEGEEHTATPSLVTIANLSWPKPEHDKKEDFLTEELKACLKMCLNFIEHSEANRGKLTSDIDWEINVQKFRNSGPTYIGIGRSVLSEKAFVDLNRVRKVLKNVEFGRL